MEKTAQIQRLRADTSKESCCTSKTTARAPILARLLRFASSLRPQGPPNPLYRVASPFPSPSQFLAVITEYADYTLSVGGLPATIGSVPSGLVDGYAIGNLIFVPQNWDKQANIFGARADNSGTSVNLWELGFPPFPYMGVLRKQ
jgi:hypothetical protein